MLDPILVDLRVLRKLRGAERDIFAHVRSILIDGTNCFTHTLHDSVSQIIICRKLISDSCA